jgi:hypothetical protein
MIITNNNKFLEIDQLLGNQKILGLFSNQKAYH